MEIGLLLGSLYVALLPAALLLSVLAVLQGSRPSCWMAAGSMSLAVLLLALAWVLLYRSGFHGSIAVWESVSSVGTVRVLTIASFLACVFSVVTGSMSYLGGAETVPYRASVP